MPAHADAVVAFIVLIAVVFGAGGVVARRTHRRDAPPAGSGTRTGPTETWNNGGDLTASACRPR